jgi:hypothetical protein
MNIATELDAALAEVDDILSGKADHGLRDERERRAFALGWLRGSVLSMVVGLRETAPPARKGKAKATGWEPSRKRRWHEGENKHGELA